ncbi:hypothetical protein BCV70DRAFT_183351 [Testicularia cyperi]|uniref:SEC7 domain-containing protein n=1 Tax=Testicularia cyperi TaxID=1882483 RepID=A0A317XX71_9BASI|nr:hypothetical protein BCV70DRAFT_183351 [Testicularia cyperi]
MVASASTAVAASQGRGGKAVSPAAGSSRLHPEPQRGAEAIANFYGRFSTDLSSSRSRRGDASVSSVAGSARRSSFGTDAISQSYSVDAEYGDHDDDPSGVSTSSSSKGPKVYNSFSAAAAAASRSSLNKRPAADGTPMPHDSPSSASGHYSPALSSPNTSSNAHRRNTSSNRLSPRPAPPIGSSSGSATDASSSYGWPLTPARAKRPDPEDAARSASLQYARAGAGARQNLSGLGTDTSPDVHEFSQGKGYGWNPEQDRGKPSKASTTKSSRGTPTSKSNINGLTPRDARSRAQLGGMRSTSEVDLPAGIRGQRKGMPAPPRLSQDPVAISIADELSASHASETTKSDSAFARLGRAFRRKSKTGSEFRADINRADFQTANNTNLPPMPRTPRRMPSHANLQPATTPVPEVPPLVILSAGGSNIVPGALASTSGTPDKEPSTVQHLPFQRPTTEKRPSVASMSAGEGRIAAETGETRDASMRVGESVDASEPKSVEQYAGAQASADESATADRRTAVSQTHASGANSASPAVRTTDNGTQARPTSMDSTTSSEQRRSMAFLASAISMGAIADVARQDEHTETLSNNQQQAEPQSESSDARTPLSDGRTVAAELTTDQHDDPPKVPARSKNRTPLEARSAVRDDHVPSILSDFLTMNEPGSAKLKSKSRSATAATAVDDELSATNGTRVIPNRPPSTRSISGTSDGRKSSFSSSPKAVRPTKGVYMSAPAGPNMGGFVSPFYVAPMTSVDAGVATKVGRSAGGRRASASSRSIHSEDSHSTRGGGGGRRGSEAPSITVEAPDLAAQFSVQEGASQVQSKSKPQPQSQLQAQQADVSDKARKVKSHGNLRSSAANQPTVEAMPRSSTSRLPSVQVSTVRGALTDGAQTSSPISEKLLTATPLEGGSSESSSSNATRKGLGAFSGASRSPSFGSRLLRRPKTSGAEAQLAAGSGPRGDASAMKQQGLSGSRGGSGPGRASLDESLHRIKLGAGGLDSSDADFELLGSQDSSAYQKSADGDILQRPRMDSVTSFDSLSQSGRDLLGSRQSTTSDRRDSSNVGRRPNDAFDGSGSRTPMSSRLESQGGAAALFGNSAATRPRTSSLLPSFGFSRSRTGSSAGLEGTSKSPGSFGASTTRSASGPATRDTSGKADEGAPSRASSSSRPSFNRQRSTSAAPSEVGDTPATKKKDKFSASAFLPYEDENAQDYAERIAETAPKTQIAAILASSADEFYIESLSHFMTRFWFSGIPLDIALRKLLMDLHLPKETQQIDRVMEAFAKRYNECNRGLFTSDDQPYILAFSLMMLHTDAFNKNAKNKMTKADYLRNTSASGVPTEILEYLFDNLTFTQFIYVEDEQDLHRRASEPSNASSLGGGTAVSTLSQSGATGAANRQRLDPYYLIAQGRLGELRPDLEHLIPEDSPFSYTGSLSSFDVDRLNAAFLHAPSIEIVTSKNQDQSGSSMPAPSTVGDEDEVVSLKVTKVGVVNRKDDVSDGGKKAASRKWKTSGLLLTGSQLLLFKDIVWINALQSQILDQVGHSLMCNGIRAGNGGDDYEEDQANVVEGGIVISPRITYFRPDGVISLADAVAVKDNSYGKYDFVFRLLAAKGRQYLIQAQSEDDMNDWIHKINFCASFRTANIKIRGLDLAPRVGDGAIEGDRSRRGDSMDHYRTRARPSQTSLLDLDMSVGSGLGLSSPSRSNLASDGYTEDAGLESGGAAGSFSRDSSAGGGELYSRPHSSASHRKMSPASSSLMKRAVARKEMMLTKIAETEVQLERAVKRLQDDIRLARHFAILTPFVKSTRDRIELAALPLAGRIRACRLEVAKTDSRCKILRLDLAAGERVARRLLPSMYLSTSALRSANRLPGSQTATPQLPEMGGMTESQAQFEDLFGAGAAAAVNGNSNGNSNSNGSSSNLSSGGSAGLLGGMVTKPATHQRNQMNLNAVSEQPADESPVMTARAELHGSNLGASTNGTDARGAGGQSPEAWDMSQMARRGSNRTSLVDLPSPNELQEATGRRLLFGQTSD